MNILMYVSKCVLTGLRMEVVWHEPVLLHVETCCFSSGVVVLVCFNYMSDVSSLSK